MAEYKAYLAAGILTEDKITYRLLSRALKIHVNAAKEMLYEFHRQQNAKKLGTIHATYLLSGTKKEVAETPAPIPKIEKDGEDEYMQSSPFVASSMPEVQEVGPVFTTTISLVREEDLEVVKSEYENIASLHIYSLGPHPLKDVQLLTDNAREIQVLTAADDPLEHVATYGTIKNPLVKRRPNRRPLPIASRAAPPVIKSKPTEPIKAAAKPSIAPKLDAKSSQSGASKDFFGKGKDKSKATADSAPSSKESTPAPPPRLKKESSSIFKSFAKTPKVKRENTDSAAEDVSMKGMEDDDDDEEEYIPPVQVQKPKNKDAGESVSQMTIRKEREAALKRMMEESDDEEQAPEVAEPEGDDTVSAKEEPVEEPEPVVQVSGGRRRGKRRVMKKKTIKDEEGYLVTKEEAAWESFSEDEPIVPGPKANPSASGAAKAKKPAGKVGQGSIMSFFGKKT